jgi:hypothetical protein
MRWARPFDDGGLAHPRLPDEHRVVLGSPGKHLNHPPHLVIPADDRIELALAGHIGEVAGVFFQGLVFAVLGIGIGDPLAAAHCHAFSHVEKPNIRGWTRIRRE